MAAGLHSSLAGWYADPGRACGGGREACGGAGGHLDPSSSLVPQYRENRFEAPRTLEIKPLQARARVKIGVHNLEPYISLC